MVSRTIIEQVLQSFEILQFKSSTPLTILPSHQLSGVQSVLMLSQQLPKCNNYSFFLFSSNVKWQMVVVGGETGCTVGVREYSAIWQSKRTHTKAWDKSKRFLKTLLWVSRDAGLVVTFLFFPSLPLSLCVIRPCIFSLSNGGFSCCFTLSLLPHTIVSLTWERKESSCQSRQRHY